MPPNHHQHPNQPSKLNQQTNQSQNKSQNQTKNQTKNQTTSTTATILTSTVSNFIQLTAPHRATFHGAPGPRPSNAHIEDPAPIADAQIAQPEVRPALVARSTARSKLTRFFWGWLFVSFPARALYVRSPSDFPDASQDLKRFHVQRGNLQTQETQAHHQPKHVCQTFPCVALYDCMTKYKEEADEATSAAKNHVLLETEPPTWTLHAGPHPLGSSSGSSSVGGSTSVTSKTSPTCRASLDDSTLPTGSMC